MKKQHVSARARSLELQKLPDDLFEPDADYGTAVAEHAAKKAAPAETGKRRQFRRFDETWAETLLAADPPVSAAVWRLALVLLA